jgi:hypothetical protein
MLKFASAVLALALAATSASAQQQQQQQQRTPQATTPAPAAQVLTSLPADAETITHWYKQSVYDPMDNKIGEIMDVLVDKEGKIVAVMVGVGGFLGIGEKDVAIPFNAVQFRTKDNNKWWPVMNATKDSLKNAPGFKYDRTAMKWVPDNAASTTGGPNAPRQNPTPNSNPNPR